MPLRALAKMTLPMMVGRRRRIEYRATLNPAARFHFRLRFFYFVGRGFLDCDPGFPATRALESERFADDYALLPFAFAEPQCGPRRRFVDRRQDRLARCDCDHFGIVRPRPENRDAGE